MKRHDTSEISLKVFYNSACPVCDAGITEQKKRFESDSENVQNIQWNDVHANNDLIDLLNSDVDLDFVRERLHIIDRHGEIQIGIDAFIALWKITPSEAWKARVVEKPVLYGISNICYNIFAFFLFRWNRFRRNW